MKRKIISLLLVASLSVTLFGCGASKDSTTQSTTNAATTQESATTQGTATTDTNAAADATTTEGTTVASNIDFSEAPYTINVSYPVYGDSPADLQKIQDKVNVITLKEINAKIEFKTVPIANMTNIYTLATSSGEKQDLIMLIPGSTLMTQYAGSKMIQPIDEILDKYGSDIKAGSGDLLKVGKLRGVQYGLPTKELVVNGKGIWLLQSIVKKYNIDISKIKTINDLDPIFEMVHTSEPELQIVFPYGTSTYALNNDMLGNGFGVLVNGGIDSTKVVNLIETDEYAAMVKKIREWYQKGYISKDFATTQSSPGQLLNANKLFCAFEPTEFSMAMLGDAVPCEEITLQTTTAMTDSSQTFIWAVPVNAKRPDKSMQFLNLTYKNKELSTLLKYGIEGESYKLNTDGTVDKSMASMKNFLQNWQIWGDVDNYPVAVGSLVAFNGDINKYNEALAQWRANTKTSKAFGFIFDPTSVKTEIAGCTAVTDQYQKLLEGGALDPDKYLKLMSDKLYAAGLQKIMDEKQRQLDEWLKTQN